MGTVVSCQDYDDFFTAQLVVLEFVFIIANLAILVAYIPYTINKKWSRNNQCLIRCKKWIQLITDAVVEIAFGRILKKHRNQEERNVYNVLNYKAPPHYTNLLFLVLVYLIVGVLVQFWDDFLLEESFECTTEHSTCCFGSQFLLLDCSNTTNLKNITKIIC